MSDKPMPNVLIEDARALYAVLLDARDDDHIVTRFVVTRHGEIETTLGAGTEDWNKAVGRAQIAAAFLIPECARRLTRDPRFRDLKPARLS